MNLLTQYIFLASKHRSYDGTKNIFEPIPPGGQHVPNYQFGCQPGRASLAFLEEGLRHYCNFCLLCNILSSDAARAARVCPWGLWVYFNSIVWIKFFFSTPPASVSARRFSGKDLQDPCLCSLVSWTSCGLAYLCPLLSSRQPWSGPGSISCC